MGRRSGNEPILERMRVTRLNPASTPHSENLTSDMTVALGETPWKGRHEATTPVPCDTHALSAETGSLGSAGSSLGKPG